MKMLADLVPDENLLTACKHEGFFLYLQIEVSNGQKRMGKKSSVWKEEEDQIPFYLLIRTLPIFRPHPYGLLKSNHFPKISFHIT